MSKTPPISGPASCQTPGPGPLVLVVNAGSSSFKYQVIDMGPGMGAERRLCQGLVERIGGDGGGTLTHKRFACGDFPEQSFTRQADYRTHAEGMRDVAAILQDPAQGGVLSSPADIFAVGHRVLLGGPDVAEALVDEKLKDLIREYIPLGPLHNPANLAGIEVMEELFPGVPNVAVFDTGFHAGMPDHAHTYAIPREMAQKHRIRRYGFHGTSHRYVAGEAARFLNRPPDELNLITCHLGNGSSVCAVAKGRSVDTSMGLTPLEGLIMGTRSGSIDPAVATYLMSAEGMSPAAMDDMLNKKSGLKGLCGRNDMRDLLDARARGDADADLAFRMFVYSLKKYIGSYVAALGRVDALVFTGGIGENSPDVRRETCRDMEALGISPLDHPDGRNDARSSAPRFVGPEDSKVAVLVVPTDEELEIARASLRVLNKA